MDIDQFITRGESLKIGKKLQDKLRRAKDSE